MPKRSPDQGVTPFEIRPGVDGLQALGGIYRAGDPATIPPHKHHLVINCRISPEGFKCRDGLSEVYDTGRKECIDGLIDDREDVGAALLLYPGAPQGEDAEAPPNYLNAMTFRAIWPEGGDLSYSEYVAVTYAAPSKDTVPPKDPSDTDLLSKVIEPHSDDGGSFTPLGAGHTHPFIFQGRACVFMVVDKPDGDSSTPAIALVSMDIPKRTNEDASDGQRAVGIAAKTGDNDELFPFDYPIGSSKVLYYPTNPFTDPETLSEILDAFVSQGRSDSPDGSEAGVRETLYFLARGSADTVAVCRWDGTTQTTIATKVGLAIELPPALGGHRYGCFIVGSSDGVYGDYMGYEDADGSWVESAQGFHYDFGVLGDPEPFPGDTDIEIEIWGAYKESPSGRPIVFVAGLVPKVYAGSWIVGRGAWAMEFDPTDGFDTFVATFSEAKNTAGGFPIMVPDTDDSAGQYVPVVVRQHELCALLLNTYETEEWWPRRHPYSAAQDYMSEANLSTYRVRTDLNAIGPWDGFWIQNVAGRLYCGGLYDYDSVLYHSVFDWTYGSDPTGPPAEVFRGDVLTVYPSGSQVSKGCLPGIPAADMGEGFAAGEDG